MVRAWEGFRFKDAWRKLQQRGMAANFSWDKSAIEYVKLYRDVLGLPAEEAAPTKQPEMVP
jgi:starch synthase